MADSGIASDTSFKVGLRVKHPVYGLGYIIAIEDHTKMGDNGNWNRMFQSSIVRLTNGHSRYNGHLNIAVKWDNGGPQGFAINASNEAKDIEVHILEAQAIY